ncbi:hypothetical protein MLD38_008251 [Melastoma candidum]|uniref:Uncharacterized protein n=1 Tax=Melastoma candidum TaxID=119954 RepID=A0ACB9RWT2_9MYRT|nr:hypothetical protein MLD38_008251 [Melastoma candidum]
MIEVGSCFSDEALKFSTPSCSSTSSSAKSSCISPSPLHVPSVCNVISCLYSTDLSSRKTRFIIAVTWCMSPGGPRLIVEFGSRGSANCSPRVRIGTSPGLLGRNRGRKRVECRNSSALVSWDFSKAKFVLGCPEPVGGFYVAVSVDSECILMLGDGERAGESSTVNSVLVSRREELFGEGMYSTQAPFHPNGELHDIVIKYVVGTEQEKEDGNDQQKQPGSTLSVYVDKKLATRVKRLQWNFRGHQTIFVDGSAIEFMWNVHDWLHNIGSGPGVFIFRTSSRVSADTERDDLNCRDNDGEDGFSLLICANKNPS